MTVKVVRKHLGEGDFPTFMKGTEVTMKDECTHFLNWYACNIEGYQTYVPDCFVSVGKLVRDYNPTELVQDVGDMLEVHGIVYAWLLAKNQNNVTGWIPAENVVSV